MDPPFACLADRPRKKLWACCRSWPYRVDSQQDLYLAAPAQGKRQGYADVRCRVAALAASFLLQMRAHSTQMACCEDNQGAAAAIRDALRAVLVIEVGGECLPAAAFIYINTMYVCHSALDFAYAVHLRTMCAPGCPLTEIWGGSHSLPEGRPVRRCNRRASVGSIRLYHKQKIGQWFFSGLFGERE
jgi:hypothetical protein